MNRIPLVIILVILLVNCKKTNKSSFNHSSDAIKVDSLFKKSFSDITKTLTADSSINNQESKFVILLSCLSGIEVGMKSGWSGILDVDEHKLQIFERWYGKNKTKVEWNNVQNALTIIKSESYSDNDMRQLKKLRIK